ncbi:MAG: thymidylate synthase [Pseudonocardiaceae bacterium]
MIILRADSANELYSAACRAVLDHGRRSLPRGMGTVEVLGAHLCLAQPRRRYIDVPPARIINPAFAVAEALWILSGSDDPWIFRYNQSLARYADDGRLQGAYGPRIRRWRDKVDQLDHVRTLLGRDPDSRQGVVQIYDAERDTLGHRDVPCTLSYRFFLREERLHMHTTMRSQDLWLGFPYDIFTTTLIQELMAGWLGASVGEYHHHVDSLHLYDKNVTGAGEVAAASVISAPMPKLAVPWDSLPSMLAGVIAGDPPASVGPEWVSFTTILASYRAWQDGDRDGARRAIACPTDDLGRALARWYEHLTRRRKARLGHES